MGQVVEQKYLEKMTDFWHDKTKSAILRLVGSYMDLLYGPDGFDEHWADDPWLFDQFEKESSAVLNELQSLHKLHRHQLIRKDGYEVAGRLLFWFQSDEPERTIADGVTQPLLANEDNIREEIPVSPVTAEEVIRAGPTIGLRLNGETNDARWCRLVKLVQNIREKNLAHKSTPIVTLAGQRVRICRSEPTRSAAAGSKKP